MCEIPVCDLNIIAGFEQATDQQLKDLREKYIEDVDIIAALEDISE